MNRLSAAWCLVLVARRPCSVSGLQGIAGARWRGHTVIRWCQRGGIIESRVEATLRDECDVRGGDVLVALVSGGSDSVAMLHALHGVRNHWTPRLELEVLHFDHRIRPESRADADFVRSLCGRLGTRCDVLQWTRAEPPTQSTAREWRRSAALDALGGREGRVVTAHHADDQVETAVLRLARGGRLTRVFSGMDISAPPFARPLLTSTKAELITYLQNRQEAWVEDASNAKSDKYARNKARHRVVPGLRELARSDEALRGRVAALAKQSRVIEDWTRQAAEAYETRHPHEGLATAAWDTVPPPVRFELLARFAARSGGAAPFAAILDLDDAILAGGNRWRRWLPGGILVEKLGDGLRVCGDADLRVAAVGTADVAVWLPDESWALVVARSRLSGGVALRGIPSAAALEVRFRADGDRFHPAWRERPAKLKDFLRGQRIPLADRDRVPILVLRHSPDDEVLVVFLGDAVHVARTRRVDEEEARTADPDLLWVLPPTRAGASPLTLGGVLVEEDEDDGFL